MYDYYYINLFIIFVQEIEDVPYLNNGVYEFKTTDYDGNALIYNSQDEIEWKIVI